MLPHGSPVCEEHFDAGNMRASAAEALYRASGAGQPEPVRYLLFNRVDMGATTGNRVGVLYQRKAGEWPHKEVANLLAEWALPDK